MSFSQRVERSGPASHSVSAASAVTRVPAPLIGERLALTFALAAVCTLELWGLIQYFPIASWLGGQPLYTDSYALHFARGLMGRSALERHLRIWSYSPTLMAGYPAATRTEPMGDAIAIWLWLWSGIGAAQSMAQAAIAYKLLVVGLLLSAPLTMAAAAHWLNFDRRVVLVSAVLGAFGTFNYPGLLMIRSGMFGFLTASFLCAAWGALLYRTLERGRAGRFILLGASGGALTYLHPLTAILIAPPALAGLLTSRNPRRSLALAASLALAFILSLGWLAPILFTLGIGVHFSNWWQTPRTIAGGVRLLFRPRLPFPALAVLAAAAYGTLRAPLRRPFGSVWLTATLVFAAMAYLGSAIRAFDNVEPGRFEATFYFYAVPFAAIGTHECWRRLLLLRSPWRRLSRGIACSAVVYFSLVAAASVWVETSVHGPIETALPAQAQELVGWMKTISPGSRLVLESGWSIDKEGGVHLPYFGADLGMLWALESGRELIGASPSEGFSSFSFVDFGNGRSFGRPLNQWDPREFRKQLDLYNVGALLLWSGDAKHYLEQVPDVKLRAESPPYALYGVEGQHSFLLEGRARSVRATQDCIEIRDAQPGRLILKYHYLRTMRVRPPMHFGPASVGNGDPTGFIQLDNDATRDIEIYNAGFSSFGRAIDACRDLSVEPTISW